MVDLDATIELSFSDLGLPVSATSLASKTAEELSVEDLNSLLSSVETEIASTQSSLQQLTKRNLPFVEKTFQAKNKVCEQVEELEATLQYVVNELSSERSFHGRNIQFQEEMEGAERRLEGYRFITAMFMEVKEFLRLMEEFDAYLKCGSVKYMAIVFTDMQVKLQRLESELEELDLKSVTVNRGTVEEKQFQVNMREILPEFEQFDTLLLMKALKIELIRKRTKLVRKLEVLLQETFTFDAERHQLVTDKQEVKPETVLVEFRVKTRLPKTIPEAAATETWNASKEGQTDSELVEGGEFERLENHVTLFEVMVAMARLNMLDRYLLSQLGPCFLREVVFAVFTYPTCKVTESTDSEKGTSALSLRVEEEHLTDQTRKDNLCTPGDFRALANHWAQTSFWGRATFATKYEHLLESLTTCLRFLAVQVLDNDEEMIDKLRDLFWGKTAGMKPGSIRTSQQLSVSYILCAILYDHVPHDEEYLFSGEIEKLLRAARGFEGELETIGFIETKVYVKVLSDYVLNHEKNMIDKQQDMLLIKARDVMKEDYYATKQVSESEERCSLLNVTGFQDLIDKNAVSLNDLSPEEQSSLEPGEAQFFSEICKLLQATFEKRSKQQQLDTQLYKHGNKYIDYYAVPTMKISRNAKNTLDLCYRIMDNLVLRIKAKEKEVPQYYIDTMFQTCRNILTLYLLFVRKHHQNVLDKSTKFAMVFVNDCEYLAHSLAVFSFMYRKCIARSLCLVP